MQHREEALRQQPAGARENPVNSEGGSRKLQGEIHHRQQKGGKERGYRKEEDHDPELYQASGPPRIKNPKGEEPLERNRPWREEQDDQKRTTPRTGRHGEESRTSARARNKSKTPLP